jgi:hypothetical protein
MSPELEEGVITAYIEKLETQTIPLALSIQKIVNEGNVLNDIEISHLDAMLSEANFMMRYLEHHDQYKKLTAELIDLYHEITEQALNNQNDAATVP